MFARVATISTLFFILPALSAAAAVARTDGGNNCNVGAVACCNSVQSSDNTQIADILSLLGIAVGPTTTQVGFNCSPISVGGSGSNSCNAQPVCCENNQFNGAVNIGCSPINVHA